MGNLHLADKAIIMAAGMGTRLQPITICTPKPLIKVHGVRMIDTMIDGLYENGISEIIIVVGYLKEKFQILKKKYPDVQLIENPYYHIYNNISSLFVAREYLFNCIILDGDQIVYNKGILNPYFEKSGYCSIWVDGYTNEWLQTVENGKVVACSKTGGSNGWQLMSVSFWSGQDGELLRHFLEVEFEQKHHTNIYWDDVVMFQYLDMFDLGVRPICREDLVEIDSFEELVRIDPTYHINRESETGKCDG